MLEALWSRLLAALDGQVPESAMESWLRPWLTTPDGDHLRVLAPNTFTRDWVGQHHVDTIQAAARTVLGGNPRVSIEIDPEPERSAIPSRERSPGAPSSDLTPRYTFQSFVVGTSNHFAQAACQAVAASASTEGAWVLAVIGKEGAATPGSGHATLSECLRELKSLEETQRAYLRAVNERAHKTNYPCVF